MNNLDPRIRVKFQGELSADEYRDLQASLLALALNETVQVTATEVKPPKTEAEALVTIPEELQGKLGDLSFAEYEARLMQEGHGKYFIYSTWNKLQRMGVIKVAVESGPDGSDVVIETPVVKYMPSYPGGEEVRPVELSDRKKNRRPWQVTGDQVRQAGHFVDLNELAFTISRIKTGDWANHRIGVGSVIAGVWAGLVKERVEYLLQSGAEDKL